MCSPEEAVTWGGGKAAVEFRRASGSSASRMDESLKQRRGNAVLSFIIIIIIIIISTSSVIISMEHSLLQDCQLEHHVTHVTRVWQRANRGTLPGGKCGCVRFSS